MIRKIRKNDTFAAYTLYTRYDKIAWKHAHSYRKLLIGTGISVDEIHAVYFSSIEKCLKAYKYSKGSFYNFWKVSSEFEIRTYMNKNSYENKAKTFVGLSLDEKDDDNLLICEMLGENDENILSFVNRADLVKFICNKECNLTKREQRVLLWTLKGKTKQEIAKHMKIGVSCIYSSYKKAILKLKKALKKQYTKN